MKPPGELICESVKTGKLKAYAITDSGFRKQLQTTQVDKIFEPVHFAEENTGSCYLSPRTVHLNPEQITSYLVLEYWTANRDAGKVEIQIAGIAPIENPNYARTPTYANKPLFWLNYADVGNIIAQYDQYHPENMFAVNIWNSFFQHP